MSKARRKWEQDLIATAALMGAVFEEVVISRRSFRKGVPPIDRIRKAWALNVHDDATMRGSFSSPHQAAYWYLVERHNLSFQNNGEHCVSFREMDGWDDIESRHFPVSFFHFASAGLTISLSPRDLGISSKRGHG